MSDLIDRLVALADEPRSDDPQVSRHQDDRDRDALRGDFHAADTRARIIGAMQAPVGPMLRPPLRSELGREAS